MLASLERGRLRDAHARAGRHHSPRAGRRRRARPGPHRHRQDGRVRHSDSRTARQPAARRTSRRRWSWCPRASWPCRSATKSNKLAHGRQDSLRRRLRRQADPRRRSTKLQKGADIVIGTPGRVLDHLGRGTLRSRSSSRFVVLDEADRMLDIGFRPDIEKILRRCPQGAADAAAQRHGRPAGRTAGPHVHARPGGDGLLAQDEGRRHDRAVLLHRRPRAEVRPAGAAAEARAAASRRSSSAAPSAAPTRSTAGCRKKFHGVDMMHGDLQQIGPRPRDEGVPRRRGAAPGGHRRGRPRHRRHQHLAHHQLRHAAVVATTTSTASAAPAAWAARASPTRSSRPKKAAS